MKVVYVKKTKEYYLVNSLSELNYDKIGLNYSRDIYGMSIKKLEEYFIIKENMTDTDGRLTYLEKEDEWVWEVYDKPRKSKTQYMNGVPIIIYNKVAVAKRIPLINMMRRSN
jgi:hypothetical protein